MTAKLYRITLRGYFSSSIGICYKTAYVVAETADKAYELYRDFLDKKDIGFPKDRALSSIELIAENYEYTDTQTLLLIEQGSLPVPEPPKEGI